MKPKFLLHYLFFAFLTFAFCAASAQSIRYVKAGATGTGTSWANASGDLQAMIRQSNAGNQIWVTGGTYYPNRKADALNTITPDDRDNAFVLKEGVKIYGSFAGGESSLTQRNVIIMAANQSILNGDLGNLNDSLDNAYHVVISVSCSNATVLNGFTIEGGNGNGTGILIINSKVVSRNNGGGIYNESSSPALTDVSISGNNATSFGGGIVNSSSSPVLTNVSINKNNASIGGGIYNSYSSPVLTNVSIIGNGDNAYRGGGIFNSFSSPVLTNVTITGNKANNSGGGIFNNGIESKPLIRNSIIYGNTAEIEGGISGGAPAISFSLVQDLYSIDNGNIPESNPEFIDAANGNYRLLGGSPVISKGNNSYFSVDSLPNLSAIKTDLDGHARISNIIDMGAYEYVAGPLGIDLVRFTAQAQSKQAKLKWTTASETNNKEFIISRSADGQTFTEIGKIAGAGNSSLQKDYTFYDKSPLSGINYYRLQQIDFDGRVTSHGIRTVEFSVAGTIRLYPSPVTNILKIEFPASHYRHIELADNNGKVIQSLNLSAVDNQKTLHLKSLPSGAYYIRFMGNGKVTVREMVKE